MSRRWQGYQQLGQQSSTTERGSDIAAQYAMQLENFHTSFLNNPQFCMNVLGYSQDSGSNVDSLLPFTLSAFPTSPNTIQSPSQHQRAASYQKANPRAQANGSAAQANISHQTVGINDARYPIETSSPQNAVKTSRGSMVTLGNHEWQNFHNPQTMGLSSGMQASQNNMPPNIDYDSVSVDDELTAMSNALLGQQFLEMDRVITYDGTNFAIDLDGWSGMN
ncbi:MAG: hypothetical protein CL912_32450 [Deltaproteobacteria bacterium]|nr:hypothetical protein [Deltaproteobacteria bacterium]|tara:strand:- start:266 stop:928 length:663 start_codon:yes stop_codon:yes gene_type:complete